MRPENLNLKPEKPNLRPERPGLSPEKLDLRPERPNLRSQRPDLRSEGPDGGRNKRTNEQTNKRKNKSPPVFYRTSSPSGPLPCLPSIKFTIMHSRATGIADHILPLGDLFVPPTPALPQNLASRPKSQPWGQNLSLQAQIPALKPKSQP